MIIFSENFVDQILGIKVKFIEKNELGFLFCKGAKVCKEKPDINVKILDSCSVIDGEYSPAYEFSYQNLQIIKGFFKR